MKIDSSVKALAGLKTGNTAAQPANAASRSMPAAEASARVQIQHAEQVDAAYDAERVAEIRQAIAEGRFQINPERIADGLIQSVRDMLAGHRQSA